MARTDLYLSENDIVVSNNDLSIVESDTQHVQDTINAHWGWWKEFWASGVGVSSYLKSKAQQELIRAIKIELEADGYNSSPIVSFSSNSNLTISPNVSI